jgi:hypothetical protein
MSSTPGNITHAITLKGAQLGWCIMKRYKDIENRNFRMKPGWYALHIGKGKTTKHFQNELKILCPEVPDENSLEKGCFIGAIHIKQSFDYEYCKNSKWAIGPICNIIDDVIDIDKCIHYNGRLSIWKIDASIINKLQSLLQKIEY